MEMLKSFLLDCYCLGSHLAQHRGNYTHTSDKNYLFSSGKRLGFIKQGNLL